MKFYHRFSFVSILSVFCLGGASGTVTTSTDIFEAVRNEQLEDIRSFATGDSSQLEDLGQGGQTPLLTAVLTGKLDSVKTLLEVGANVLATEKDGYDVLHAAGFQGRAEILTVLLDHFHQHAESLSGQPLDPTTDLHPDGYYPLHRACWGRAERHAETVRVFLEAGVPFDQASRDGKTCAQMSRNEQTHAILRQYQERDAKEL